MLRVHAIETFGTHEGPGIRLVIFLQGCNFDCLYCHNPDSRPLNQGKIMTYDELFSITERMRPYFIKKGGITISGGEPLLQAKQLIPFFEELKKRGFHTALDTNGSILTEEVKKLLELTDLVLPDIKHINPLWHTKITGMSNNKVKKFIEYLCTINKPFWVRYVVVPGYTNQEEYVHEVGKYIKTLSSMERIELLPYHRLGYEKRKKLGRKYPLEGVEPPTHHDIEVVKSILETYVPGKVWIRK